MNNKQKNRLWSFSSIIVAFVLVLIGITGNVKNVNAASFRSSNTGYCSFNTVCNSCRQYFIFRCIWK